MSWQAIGVDSGQIYAIGKSKAEVCRQLQHRFPSCRSHNPFRTVTRPIFKLYPEPLLMMCDKLTATDAATIRFLHRPKAGVKANG